MMNDAPVPAQICHYAGMQTQMTLHPSDSSLCIVPLIPEKYRQ